MSTRADRSHELKAFIDGAFQEWERGDSSTLFEYIADDVVWTLAGSCPGGGTFKGKERFLEESARPLHARLAQSPVPIVDAIIAEGHVVVVQWHGSGVTLAGNPYNNNYCWVFRFSGDRIVEITSYLDTAAVTRVYEES